MFVKISFDFWSWIYCVFNFKTLTVFGFYTLFFYKMFVTPRQIITQKINLCVFISCVQIQYLRRHNTDWVTLTININKRKGYTGLYQNGHAREAARAGSSCGGWCIWSNAACQTRGDNSLSLSLSVSLSDAFGLVLLIKLEGDNSLPL